MLITNIGYIMRMPEHQKTIYHLTCESLATTKDLPFIEVVKKKGFEVLLLGKFELSGNPPAPHGVPQIEVTFDGEQPSRMCRTVRYFLSPFILKC